MGVEPTTYTMRTYRSSQLSYCPFCVFFCLIYTGFIFFQALLDWLRSFCFANLVLSEELVLLCKSPGGVERLVLLCKTCRIELRSWRGKTFVETKVLPPCPFSKKLLVQSQTTATLIPVIARFVLNASSISSSLK